MIGCRECESKQDEIERQRRMIDAQAHELKLASARVKELEQALLDRCDYAEVCQHFPGAEVLASRT
jgi:predicted ATPase